MELSPTTGLIGHDSWADGRLGNGSASRVVLNDYLLIDEFIGLSREERFRKLNSLGDEAAEFIRHLLPKALTRFQNIILLTHVPPFKESCWHRGMVSDDEYLPHFSCKSFGDALADTMKHRPESHLTVLCGHTHSKGEATILPNLHVKTGEAEYSYPRVQEVIEIE
ncbi:MAG: hypothetical protein EPO24_15695 [Bacteroidetes bacterium]|nr:MAG: hypothetical protein EPO24_15695 [Bacteroidota bacterium]